MSESVSELDKAVDDLVSQALEFHKTISVALRVANLPDTKENDERVARVALALNDAFEAVDFIAPEREISRSIRQANNLRALRAIAAVPPTSDAE